MPKNGNKQNIIFNDPGQIPQWVSAAAVITFLVFIIIILYVNVSDRKYTHIESSYAKLDLNVQSLLNRIEHGFENTEKTLSHLSELRDIASPLLRREVFSTPSLDALVAFDGQGNVSAAGGARGIIERHQELPANIKKQLMAGLRSGNYPEDQIMVFYRHLFDEEGAYTGSIYAYMNMEKFSEDYHGSEISLSYSYAIFNESEKILWGYDAPQGKYRFNIPLSDMSFFRALDVQGFQGQGLQHFTSPSALIVSQQMSAYPLRLVMAAPMADVLQNWNDDIQNAVAIGVFACLGGAAFLFLWRVMVQRQNRSSADLYQLYQVIEQTPVSFAMTDLKAQAVYVNAAFQELTGYEREEVLGQNLRLLRSGNTHDEIYQDMWSHLTRGIPWRGELLNRRKDGSLYWEDALMAPLKNSHGVVTYYVAFKSDITETKIQKEQLQEIIWGTRAGTWVWFLASDLLIVNERLAEILGYTIDELQPITNSTWKGLAHPRDYDISYGKIHQHLAGETDFYECELRMRHRDGRWIWILDRGQVTDRSSEGKPLRMAGTRTDITERKKLEIELGKSEEKYRRLVEQTQREYFIYSHDAHGVFQYVSPSISYVLGYEPQEFLKRFSHFLTDSEINEKSRQHTIGSMKGIQQPSYDVEVFHKDGGRRILEVSESPVFGDDGEVIAVEGIAHDLTRRRENEAKLAVLHDALEKSNGELQQFAYSISHDLQAPLRTVSSFLQLLERRYGSSLDDGAREYIGFAVDGSKRMSRMITDLLEYSRVESKGAPFQQVAMGNAARDAVANLSALIEDCGAVIQIGDLPVVSADPSQMMRLVQNLLENAIKYRSPERGPKISIAAERRGEVWVISVQDNGIGIEPRYFEQVFALFNRAGASNDVSTGTGVGLSVCRRIVERHDGEIWLDSSVGVGSTFFFSIPASSPGSDGVAGPQ